MSERDVRSKCERDVRSVKEMLRVSEREVKALAVKMDTLNRLTL
jgi:hypothetical protein